MQIMQRLNSLYETPEFYNTLTDDCMTSIMKLVEDFSWTDINLDYRIMLPSYSNQVAHEIGFLPTNIPSADLQKRAFLILPEPKSATRHFQKKLEVVSRQGTA